MRLFAFLFVCVALGPAAFAEPRVIGYYASWAKHYTPADIPAEKLTHINYAFGIIRDGKCTVNNLASAEKQFEGLRALKQKHPHLRTLISVGGWTDSAGFTDAALTEESRKVFASSCVEFAAKHGFDGVDIDWEFPVSGGYQGYKGRPEDTVNFTLLLKELRALLDAQGKADGKTYLLTIAVAASKSHAANLQLGEIVKLLDFINLMTYDFAGPWSKTTGFNAPLLGQSSCESAVKVYLAAGAPPEKLCLGVPFYGRAWGGVKDVNRGLDQPHDGKWPLGIGSGQEWSWRDIAANYLGKGPTRHWSDKAKVPWLFDAGKGLMVSYDDHESLKLKANFARDQKLGGVMIWELSEDDAESTLLNALHEGLRSN